MELIIKENINTYLTKRENICNFSFLRSFLFFFLRNVFYFFRDFLVFCCCCFCFIFYNFMAMRFFYLNRKDGLKLISSCLPVKKWITTQNSNLYMLHGKRLLQMLLRYTIAIRLLTNKQSNTRKTAVTLS